MSMRIENGNIGTVGGSGSSGSVRSVGVDEAAHSAAGDLGFSDTVSLSGASNLVALARKVNSADRQSRISSIADAVRSGSYQFRPADVAQALLKLSV